MGTRVEKKELGMLHKAVLLESGKWLLLTTKGFEVYIREGSATVGCRKGSTLELKIIHCSLGHAKLITCFCTSHQAKNDQATRLFILFFILLYKTFPSKYGILVSDW